MATGAWDRTAGIMYVSAAVMGSEKSTRNLTPDGMNPYRQPPKRTLADLFAAGRQQLAEKRAREAQAQTNGDGHGS
jgi:hypothetical protein